MKKIIVTVGTSIFENYLKKNNDIKDHYEAIKEKSNKDWDDTSTQNRINAIKDAVLKWAGKNPNASAEIKSINKLSEYLRDNMDIHLISTDTVLSRLAAEIICKLLSDRKEINISFNVKNDVISGLQVKDYNELKEYGLSNLVQRIISIINGYYDNIIFNITGGFKAFIPYLTIMAAVNKFDLVYIFEDTDTLISIRPLPIKIDNDFLHRYYEEITLLENGIKNYSSIKGNNYKAFEELEKKGFVDKVDNEALLSPIGEIFFNQYNRNFFTFYCPDDVYEEIEKQQDIKRIIREKFTNKELLDSKTEIKGDHYEYDDGDNNNRIFYFKHNGHIYIYKTFQSEELSVKFIDSKLDKNRIIQSSKIRKLEVQDV